MVRLHYCCDPGNTPRVNIALVDGGVVRHGAFREDVAGPWVWVRGAFVGTVAAILRLQATLFAVAFCSAAPRSKRNAGVESAEIEVG